MLLRRQNRRTYIRAGAVRGPRSPREGDVRREWGRGPRPRWAGALRPDVSAQQCQQRGYCDDRSHQAAGNPAGNLGASTDPTWLEQTEQSLCHREPLFLGPTGLAVGLALKELRYGISSDSPPDPDRVPFGSPAPSVWDEGIRQVFSSEWAH